MVWTQKGGGGHLLNLLNGSCLLYVNLIVLALKIINKKFAHSLTFTCLLPVMILSLMVLNLLSSAPSLSSWIPIIRSMFSIWVLQRMFISWVKVRDHLPF